MAGLVEPIMGESKKRVVSHLTRRQLPNSY